MNGAGRSHRPVVSQPPLSKSQLTPTMRSALIRPKTSLDVVLIEDSFADVLVLAQENAGTSYLDARPTKWRTGLQVGSNTVRRPDPGR